MDSIQILKPEYLNRLTDFEISCIQKKINELKIHSHVELDLSFPSMTFFCNELNLGIRFIKECCK